MKFLVILIFFVAFHCFSNVTDSLYLESINIQKTGMIILGSWSVLNLTSGAYGWSQYTGEDKYFHQMNFFWNTVNLGIASFALNDLFTKDISLMSDSTMLQNFFYIKKVLLINAALDLGYIGTGIYLRSRAKYSKNRSDILNGYGSSLIIQGSFLLIFDTVLYYVLDDIDLINSHKIKIVFDHFNSAIHFRYYL